MGDARCATTACALGQAPWGLTGVSVAAALGRRPQQPRTAALLARGLLCPDADLSSLTGVTHADGRERVTQAIVRDTQARHSGMDAM